MMELSVLDKLSKAELEHKFLVRCLNLNYSNEETRNRIYSQIEKNNNSIKKLKFKLKLERELKKNENRNTN